MFNHFEEYVGIDEAGRGCIGGELVFTGAKVHPNSNVNYADDSKQLSSNHRSTIVEKLKNDVDYHTVITTAEEIDKIGLSKAIQHSLESIINYFEENYDSPKFLYDGNKTFGVNHPNLETLVKADAKVKIVGAASIIAKHTKDELMAEHHSKFPEYDFLNNNGYITKKHIKAIKEYGYSPIHRHSYKIKELEKNENSKYVNILF